MTPWTLLHEGQALPGHESPALSPLFNAGLLTRCNKSNQALANAPGLFSFNDQLFIVLPRCYKARMNQPGFTLAKSVFLNMVALERFHKEQVRRSVGRQDSELTTFACGQSRSLIDYVEAALLLWQDYREHGALTRLNRKLSTTRPGRIVWPRTLREGHPMFSKMGTVFTEIHRSSVRRDVHDRLVLLHRQCCLKIGRLLSKDCPDPSTPFSRKEALDILSANRHRCFSDRHRKVHRLLERLFSRGGRVRAQQSESLSALFLKRFEYLWERVLQVALGHQSERLPGLRGRVYANCVESPSQVKKRRGLSLIPDVVTQDPDDPSLTLILDAKDYDLHSWPGSGDIAKQMLYRLLLSKEGGCADGPAMDSIGNAFLFPSLKVKASQYLSLRGFHVLNEQHGPMARMGRIAGLDVNYELATRAYLSGKPSVDLLRRVSQETRRFLG